LNVLDGSLYAAVQQEIAVTHFLGVSSLNSGRGQPRPFFIDPFAEQISASGTAATGGDAIERIAVDTMIDVKRERSWRRHFLSVLIAGHDGVGTRGGPQARALT
jgi:hypothetical protein